MQKILIVEDDPSLSGALLKRLSEEGFEVAVSEDGETGTRKAEEFRPDLILLDIILPKKNGFKVLEELRAKEDFHKVPVLILTNLESNFDISRASEFHISAYLVKANYSLDEIVLKIRQTLADKL